MRLKSSSIYYALFMSLIISLFLGGMILFSSVSKQFSSQLELEDRLIQNAHSGIEYGLASAQELEFDKKTEVDLFEEQIDSVAITKTKWGAFTVISSQAHLKNKSYQKTSLAGQTNEVNSPNLYLVDQGRAVSLSGETRIEGKCLAPESGFKRAYIEGKNYQGTQMVYGSLSKSEKSLPKIQDNFASEILSFSGLIEKWEDVDSVEVPFSETGKHFIDDNFVSLQNTYLKGQLVLEAKDSIFVGRNAQLDQVILKSRVIYIEKGFVGTAQFFATEKIVLEEEVTLTYPSVLGLLEQESPKIQQNLIQIGAKSRVLGSVFAVSEHPNFRLPVQIDVAKESQVDGLVYCQGKTQLKGTVNGSLYTQKFYLETPSSKYENHLLDAQILDDLPQGFIYISLFETNNPLTQLQWLD